jgi:Glycosyltransferase family 17
VIWAPVMFRNEFDMLRMRIEECAGFDVTHVAVEAPWTHRAVPKPRLLARWLEQGHNRDWAAAHRLTVLADDWDPDPHAPWVNEHHQRNRAWTHIDRQAAGDDWVLIGDVDEIPSRELLSAGPGIVIAVPMRTYLFAVDWQVTGPVPPTCVAARVWWLRTAAQAGNYLAEVRDDRDNYPLFPGHGGWHFSWCGGPADQAEKLDTATCHTEILATQEAALIRAGRRWASAENGGGLPVRPVTVDRTWPAYIAERRCPPDWFRPKGPAAAPEVFRPF